MEAPEREREAVRLERKIQATKRWLRKADDIDDVSHTAVGHEAGGEAVKTSSLGAHTELLYQVCVYPAQSCA